MEPAHCKFKMAGCSGMSMMPRSMYSNVLIFERSLHEVSIVLLPDNGSNRTIHH